MRIPSTTRRFEVGVNTQCDERSSYWKVGNIIGRRIPSQKQKVYVNLKNAI
jgi:hypothetical protein